MTKAQEFINALRALCREHRVMLSTSMYDCFQVWPLKPGGDELYGDGVEDRIEGEPVE